MKSVKHVYYFDKSNSEWIKKIKSLLGGKSANLTKVHLEKDDSGNVVAKGMESRIVRVETQIESTTQNLIVIKGDIRKMLAGGIAVLTILFGAMHQESRELHTELSKLSNKIVKASTIVEDSALRIDRNKVDESKKVPTKQ